MLKTRNSSQSLTTSILICSNLSNRPPGWKMVNFVQNRANSDRILSTDAPPYNLENDRLFFSSNVTFKATFIEKKHQISILLIVFVVKTCRTRFLSFFVPQMYLEICRGLCYHSCILLVHTSVQSYCTYLKILINLSGRKKLGM